MVLQPDNFKVSLEEAKRVSFEEAKRVVSDLKVNLQNVVRCLYASNIEF